MERNATSSGHASSHTSSHTDQQGTGLEKSGQKDEGNAPQQQQPAGQQQPNMQKESVWKRFKVFLWNPQTREFMGRTSSSWGQIMFFYLCFYSFLAGMFATCMYVMLLTVSPFTPTYRDRLSPPGAMTRPHIRDAKMNFSISDRKSWQQHVDELNYFLRAYDDAVQEAKNLNCTPGQYFFQDTIESETKQACQFKRSLLGDCSGLNDSTYGYSFGEPCILLKMNRIIGYKPGYGSPLTVSCGLYRGEGPLPDVIFSPHPMFDLMYYPYYGKFTHLNYVSPLVAMQFKNVTLSRPIDIQCKLHGTGIINNFNPDKFLGRIVLKLQVRP